MNYLKKDIKLNTKFILVLLLINIIVIGVYYSYALFEITVIQNSVVKIETGTIDITTSVSGSSTPTITLAAGESKTVTVNLTTDLTHDIAYKMYHNGTSDLKVYSNTAFANNIVEGLMNQTKTIVFTFENTGTSSITFTLGTQGGIKGNKINLTQGTQIVISSRNAYDLVQASMNQESCGSFTIASATPTYLGGLKSCMNYNYVWYSGKLWRIFSVDTDESIGMITENSITSIFFGPTAAYYTDESTSSHVYQWLNEDFLNTLNNTADLIITDYNWNVVPCPNKSCNSLPPFSTPIGQKVTSAVGLLNASEYYNYYSKFEMNNFLVNNSDWWLLTGNGNFSEVASNLDNVYNVYNNGNFSSQSIISNYTRGIRPVIYLKPDVEFIGGDGSKDHPYHVVGDNGIADIYTLLNQRSSGEYVNFDNELYRIVGIENNTTKLIKVDHVSNEEKSTLTKQFSSGSTIYGSETTDKYWDYYLNNTFYNNISYSYQQMMVKGTYYLGTVAYPTSSAPSASYKSGICATASNTVPTSTCTKTTTRWTGYVGLPRMGEMFAINVDNIEFNSIYLITPETSSSIYYIDAYGSMRTDSIDNDKAARPTIHLSSNVKIIGGDGTEQSPYEISL